MDQDTQKFWDTAFISFATAFLGNGPEPDDHDDIFHNAAIEKAATCADLAVECRTEKIKQLR